MLSVFNGSFTLEDAAFVMGPLVRLGDANERLTSLLENRWWSPDPKSGRSAIACSTPLVRMVKTSCKKAVSLILSDGVTRKDYCRSMPCLHTG